MKRKISTKKNVHRKVVLILIFIGLVFGIYFMFKYPVITGNTIMANSSSCKDTDDGNIYIKGNITYSYFDSSLNKEIMKIAVDSCVLIIYPFPTFSFYLKEFYCLDDIAYNELVKCPTGYACKKGACIKN